MRVTTLAKKKNTMSTNDGGPAFPAMRLGVKGDVVPDRGGMSLRDYLAAKAMQAAATGSMEGLSKEGLAVWAYQMADAMLTVRAAEPQAAPVQQVGEMLQADIEPRPLSHPLRDYHVAMSEGPLHYTWEDKPHRLVYDLIAAVRYYALSTRPELSDADLKRIGTIYSRSVLSGNGPDYAGMRAVIAALTAAR